MRSINLLPKERRDAFRKEFWRRVVRFYGTIVLGLLVILAGELIAMDVAFRVERTALIEENAFKKELKGLDALEERASQIKGMVAVAERFVVEPPLASYELGEVLRVTPPEIVLAKIEFVREGKRIELTGRAADRNALLVFERKLKESPAVANVVLPFGNLVKAKDIDFIITVNLI